MKLPIIITGMLLVASLAGFAQEPNQQTKVRIKKTEMVNGVAKTTDTVYVTNGPVTLNELSPLREGSEPTDKKMEKIIVITDEVHGDNVKEVRISENMDADVKEALEKAGSLLNGVDIDRVMIVDDKNGSAEPCTKKIMIIKTIRITEPSEADKKEMDAKAGFSDNKLFAEEMKFAPNPNNGKFNLSFTLKEQGNTQVQVMSLDGKNVYNENLENFTGHYSSDIDISAQPKGVYFVRISQGTHSQLKKIILD